MLRPADVLLVGAALVAVLFFIGGLVDVYSVPVNPKRRRPRKPVRRRRKPGRPGRAELLEEWVLRALTTPEVLASRMAPTPERIGELTSRPVPVIEAMSPAPEIPEHPAPSGESIEHTGSASGLQETRAVDSHQPGRAATRLTCRFLNLAASAILLALILGTFVLRDGGTVSVQPRLGLFSLARARQAKVLEAVGDYEGARKLYQEALRATPEDVSLWYALGVTLSHLDHRKEAEEAFRYVVHRGKPNSEEVRFARRWLVSAGVLPSSETFTTASPVSHVAKHTAVVHGKVMWDGLEPDRPPLKVRILLHGLSGGAEGKRFSKRVALGQGYRFEDLPSGSYRLIGRVEGGALLWDQRVDVEEGKEIAFDLSKENSSNPKDALG